MGEMYFEDRGRGHELELRQPNKGKDKDSSLEFAEGISQPTTSLYRNEIDF